MFLILIFIFGIILLAMFVMDNFGKSGQPPGPIQFPILGSLIQVILSHSVHYLAIDKLSKKYGKVMTIKMGVLNIVFISDYYAFKEIFDKEEANGRRLSGIFLDRQFGNQDIGLIGNGTSWEETRKFCAESLKQYGFGNRRVIESRFLYEMEAFFQELEENMLVKDGMVNFTRNLFDPILMNTMLSMLVGERFSHKNAFVEELIIANDNFTKNGVVCGGLLTSFPVLRHLFPKLLGVDDQLKGIQSFHSISKKILENRQKDGGYKTNPNCFVDDFLRKMETSSSLVFTVESFQVIFIDIFQAGSDTTGNSINFATLLISCHPNVQTALFNEIMEICGQDRVPSLADRINMPYTQAVLTEVIRWNRVAVFGALRSAIRDFKYEKYIIRKGTLLFPNFHSIFFDEEFWGDPHIFRPERFLDENKNLIKIKLDRVAAFGSGRRSCFGEVVARDLMFLYVTILFQRYKFTIPENCPKPNIEPKINLTFGPHPYTLCVERR